jgi:hypothetical protein
LHRLQARRLTSKRHGGTPRSSHGSSSCRQRRHETTLSIVTNARRWPLWDERAVRRLLSPCRIGVRDTTGQLCGAANALAALLAARGVTPVVVAR